MIFEVTLFDNDTGERMNEEPFRITAFEGLENTSIVGSGLIRKKDEQLENLARDGARQLHEWLIDNADWFIPDPDQARTEYDRDEWAAKLADAKTAQAASAEAQTEGSGGTVSTLALPVPAN